MADFLSQARPVLGVAVLLLVAWGLSEDRRTVPWRVVAGGLLLQLVLALLLLRVGWAREALLVLNRLAAALQDATDTGTGFVFGYLAGGNLPFAETHPGAAFILAFKALPLVLVISALGALLFHWGVLQRVTAAFAWLLRRSMGLGGALALGAAIHVFVGMIEAPLLVRPYLARMERGELFALMTCGMAGVAGTVMVIYATILGPVIPDALSAILVASVISTPAGLAMAALMVPFAPAKADDAAGELSREDAPVGVFDALVKGTMDGVAPLVGITVILIVAVTLVTLVNAALAHLPDLAGAPPTLQRLLAYPLRPAVWLIGVPWPEAPAAAELLGTKTILNEFAAYLQLASLPAEALGSHGRLVMIYALCGFANLGSVGILVGGIGAMVPERRQEVVALGSRSLISGTLATLSSGALAGLLAG